MPPVITTRGLTKTYGDVRAVDDVDLTVHQGECFALLGPNGAGKTTTVEMLEGYRKRTSGDIDVLGFDPETGGTAFRQRIGIVLQKTGVERELKVIEALDYYGRAYPRRRDLDEVLGLVGLGEKRSARIRTLSGGQLRRLDLALVLVGDPEILFLDEPTTGFDPSARRQSWDLIGGLRELGKTILLTTHFMDEAQYLADRVAVIAAGRIIAEGHPDDLAGRGEGGATIRFSVTAPVDGLTGHGLTPDVANGTATLRSEDLPRTLHALTSWALETDDPLAGLTVTRESLEDTYLRLTDEDSQR